MGVLMRLSTTVLFTALLLCGACSSNQTRRPAERTSTSVIDPSEIRSSAFTDAYSLVQSLRPHWLRPRGATSFLGRDVVMVYVDGSRVGGPTELRQIPTRSILTLRFLDGIEATQRWGLDHGAGAIVATTSPNGYQ
jgi:hypothetical protein